MVRSLKIGMILDNEFTGDLRVENEVQSLQKAGHQVFVFCLTHGEKPESELYHGAHIIRIPLAKFWKKKLNGLNNTLFNFYPIWWRRHIIRLCRKYNIEALHVHDLWLLEGAIEANKQLGLPLVSDLHENYVHALANYKWSTTFPGNILVSQAKWKKCEKKWLSKVDHIIVVIEEAAKRIENKVISSKDISVVANYVNLDDFKVANEELVNKIRLKHQGCYNVTYTGGFDLHRGIENVVKAVPRIVEEVPNFRLVLVGAGSNLEDLKLLTTSLGVEDNVSFEGWQKPEDLPAYIAAADAGIIPHMKTNHTDNTIPHKLFQYMLMSKPVLTSNCDPLIRIVNETKSGNIFVQLDVNDIADKIIDMAKNVDEAIEKGKLGRQAVMDKYNWTATSKTLINLYSNISNA